MSLILMMARSVLTYGLFRGTRTITKSGFDSIEGIISLAKPATCDSCGELWGNNPPYCPDCGHSLRKIYKDYEEKESLIDKDLDMNSLVA